MADTSAMTENPSGGDHRAFAFSDLLPPRAATASWASLRPGGAAQAVVLGLLVALTLGYVAAKTPEKTMAALQEKLPRPYWVEINALLVPFGKHVCTGVRPKCSTCPLLEMCQQVGVTRHE